MNTIRWITASACVLPLAACQRPPMSGPPEVALGRVECAECGMLIVEDRCSAALLLDDRGRRDYAHYDDIGCLLDHERTGLDGRKVLERHVHDYATRAWINADTAWFLFTDPDSLRTPMGTGIGAFGTADGATAMQQTVGGKVLGLRDLAKERAESFTAGSGTR